MFGNPQCGSAQVAHEDITIAIPEMDSKIAVQRHGLH